MKRMRGFLNSLLGHVTVPLLMIMIVVSALVILINVRSYQMQKEEVLALTGANLEGSHDVLVAQLDVMSSFYHSIFINSDNYLQLKKPVSEKSYYLAATQMLMEMDDIFFSYSGIACTYCYVADRNYLIQSSTHPNYEQSELIKEYVKERHARTEGTLFTLSTWHIAEIGETVYLINTIRQTSFEMGIVIDCSSMLRNMHILDDFRDGALYYTDEDGNFILGIASVDGVIDDCTEERIADLPGLQVSCACAKVPGSMHLYLPKEPFLESLFRQTWLTIAVLLGALILATLLVLYFFYRFTVKPVQDITVIAQELESGEIGQRLPETGPVREITAINHNFNQMVSAITTLKIDLYEEKLRHQAAELAQLRLQLNPHLLLNSLNLIYTMTRQQHYDVSMRFTMCLIRHFRFILRKNHNFVPLSEELAFCENYMEILSLQYPSYFMYEIRLSDETIKEQTLVPPLSIENLIENSVKYGLTQDVTLHVGIHIDTLEKDGLHCTRIVVSDDGPGYSEEALIYIHRLQSGEDIRNLASDGVGLKNLIERLRILYEGEAELVFENDGGAKVTMTIPSVWPQKTKPETTPLSGQPQAMQPGQQPPVQQETEQKQV